MRHPTIEQAIMSYRRNKTPDYLPQLEATCRDMCDDLRVTWDEKHGGGYTQRDTICKHLGEIKKLLLCIDEQRQKGGN